MGERIAITFVVTFIITLVVTALISVIITKLYYKHWYELKKKVKVIDDDLVQGLVVIDRNLAYVNCTNQRADVINYAYNSYNYDASNNLKSEYTFA